MVVTPCKAISIAFSFIKTSGTYCSPLYFMSRIIFKIIFLTPIKHMDCKNQRIFGIGLANHLILLMPKFKIACYARKTWCGKYLLNMI